MSLLTYQELDERGALALAFAQGEQHGRSAWPIALILGWLSGVAMTGLCFVLFG